MRNKLWNVIESLDNDTPPCFRKNPSRVRVVRPSRLARNIQGIRCGSLRGDESCFVYQSTCMYIGASCQLDSHIWSISSRDKSRAPPYQYVRETEPESHSSDGPEARSPLV